MTSKEKKLTDEAQDTARKVCKLLKDELEAQPKTFEGFLLTCTTMSMVASRIVAIAEAMAQRLERDGLPEYAGHLREIMGVGSSAAANSIEGILERAGKNAR